MAIDSLTLDNYHQICSSNLSQHQTIIISPGMMVNLATAIACSLTDPLELPVEIASLPHVELYCDGWFGVAGELMVNGWTR
jgi:hypothetical protein